MAVEHEASRRPDVDEVVGDAVAGVVDDEEVPDERVDEKQQARTAGLPGPRRRSPVRVGGKSLRAAAGSSVVTNGSVFGSFYA